MIIFSILSIEVKLYIEFKHPKGCFSFAQKQEVRIYGGN